MKRRPTARRDLDDDFPSSKKSNRKIIVNDYRRRRVGTADMFQTRGRRGTATRFGLILFIKMNLSEKNERRPRARPALSSCAFFNNEPRFFNNNILLIIVKKLTRAAKLGRYNRECIKFLITDRISYFLIACAPCSRFYRRA